ncbi:hypothetical protein HHL22_13775 [Hymenobacter sp. RP-2-7]|uniref:NTF2 fold domain-containing protein n=1 Tax=Hymenobacter polaris TaxID=2682546 RepID=A0A7Y0AFC0_9BACT|nr:YbbC/YhhH family protein [Hymenobacter polaris]NML66277.1 hypothetical protein [Hymenobacter polaris]
MLFLLAKAAPASAQKFAGRTVLGEKVARQQVQQATKGLPSVAIRDTPALPTPEAAITAAEPLLFQKYGRKQILSERPYEVYPLNGYWYITGTLPTGYEGGTFEIILAANDGRVIRLTHYQ